MDFSFKTSRVYQLSYRKATKTKPFNFKQLNMSDSEEVIPEKKGRGRPPAGDKPDKVQHFLSSLQMFFFYYMLSLFLLLIETQGGARKGWFVTGCQEKSRKA